ncbi:MAG: hypothetical protein ACRD4S_14430 [Candidatus Acidiferrales bacterium]
MWNKSARVAIGSLGIAALALFCLIEWDVHERLVHLDQSITDVDRNLAIVGGAATDLEKTLRDERQASAEQVREATAAFAKLNAGLDASREMVERTDESINGELVPEAEAALREQNASLLNFETVARQAMKSVAPVLENTAHVTAAAAKLAADPAIPQTLENVAEGTKQAAEAIASANRQIQMVEPVTKKATTPPGRAARVLHIVWAVLKEAALFRGGI